MNKKGFTLVELLAAITILAVIALITTTTVTNFLKNGKEDLYQKQLNNIKLAAKTWASDNKEALIDTDCYTLTLQQLKDGNYIDDDIKDPVDGKELNNTKVVVNITKEGKTYKYELNTKGKACPKEYAISDEVTLTNHDNEKYHVIGVGDDFLTLLKDQPLTVDEVNTYGGVGTEDNHVNKNTYSSQGTAYNRSGYGGMAYYSSPTCGYPYVDGIRQSLVTSGCSSEGATNYANSDIKYVVDAWAADKFTSTDLKEVEGYKARLVQKEELRSQFYPSCSESADYCDSESAPPSWSYAPNFQYYYWTMTQWKNSSLNVWDVNYVGRLVFNDVNDNLGAVRPVINIKKSALEGGSNNE